VKVSGLFLTMHINISGIGILDYINLHNIHSNINKPEIDGRDTLAQARPLVVAQTNIATVASNEKEACYNSEES
jgi:hypothetical protein